MQGQCDACGKQAELREYTRKWFGGADRTSLLCDDCLDGIGTRRNLRHDALGTPVALEAHEVRLHCGTEPLVDEDEQQRLTEKEADFRPSITVRVDGEERLHFTGKNPTHQPSKASFTRLRRELRQKPS